MIEESFNDLFQKSNVKFHRLQKDYEHIADFLEKHPPKDTITNIAKHNTGKVIDLDRMFNNLMNPDTFKGGEGSGKKDHKKIINLTTKQKSDKHFDDLEEAKRKKEIKNYSSEQIADAYNVLFDKEKDRDKDEQKSNLDKSVTPKVKDMTEQPTTVDHHKRKFVKVNMKEMETLAKRIKQKTFSVGDFSKQFILEVKSVPKYKTLSLKHFTDKQLKRLRDFSMNNVGEEFGI